MRNQTRKEIYVTTTKTMQIDSTMYFPLIVSGKILSIHTVKENVINKNVLWVAVFVIKIVAFSIY